MSRISVALLAVAVSLLAGCSSGSEHEPVLAEAYAGPAALKLRRGIDPRSAEAATVHHGERLQIVARRRRFVKVRTANGAEGWTDLLQLLSSDQMRELDRLAELARKLPSQGAATVYEALNVHNEANRQAPSFYRLKEGELADVVLDQLAPRVPYESRGNVIPPPAPSRKPPRKPREEPRYKPPKPAAPKLPENWQELSKTDLPPEPPPEPPTPVPMDDWTLVRLRNGRAGWVLTGMLRMNIPDEVAQYSEGHRITSYFNMADVNDNGAIKHQWLWTTLSTTRVPYQFDSFRYFIWNVRHHRYETAYIEKGLKGYFPVEVHPVQMMEGNKTAAYPGFSLILEDADGVRWKKTYGYQIYRVRLVDAVKLESPPPTPQSPAPAMQQPQAPPPPRPTLLIRLQRNIASIKRKWFGR